MNLCATPAPPVIALTRPRAVTGQSGIFTRLSAGGNRIRTIDPALCEKGLSAVAGRTDKLDGVIKHRSSRETTMVGREPPPPRPSLSRRDRWFESILLQRRVRVSRIGGDMGAALDAAQAMKAYTISNRGTWLRFANKRRFHCAVESDPNSSIAMT